MSTSKMPLLFLLPSLALTALRFTDTIKNPIAMPIAAVLAGIGVILLGLERQETDKASGKRFFIVGGFGILVALISLIVVCFF